MSNQTNKETIFVESLGFRILKSDYDNYKDKVGQCTKCQEHAPLLDPCCNAPLLFEGSNFFPEKLNVERK